MLILHQDWKLVDLKHWFSYLGNLKNNYSENIVILSSFPGHKVTLAFTSYNSVSLIFSSPIQGEIWIWWAQNIIKLKETEEPVAQGHHVVEDPWASIQAESGQQSTHFLCEEVYPEIVHYALISHHIALRVQTLVLFTRALLRSFWLSAQFSWSSLWELTWMTSKASFRSLYDLSR